LLLSGTLATPHIHLPLTVRCQSPGFGDTTQSLAKLVPRGDDPEPVPASRARRSRMRQADHAYESISLGFSHEVMLVLACQIVDKE
jgi:hypothetical protein